MSYFKPLIREHVLELKNKHKPPRINGLRAKGMNVLADFNESPDPFTAAAARYTEAQDPALISSLAKTYGTSPDHIYLTPGADEAIRYLTIALCDAQDAILIHGPTYPNYASYADIFQTAAIDVPLKQSNDNFKLDTANIIKQINDADERLKLVYLCNPNNPTGSYFDENDIHDILKAAEKKGIAVVVDEAYIEFSGKDSILKKEADHPNMIVLRTLSKAYSLAGERVGVVICQDPELLDALDTVSPVFPIPQTALAKAGEVLDPIKEGYFREKRARIADQRDTLRESIQEAKGITGFRSSASCLLVGSDAPKELHHAFARNGVSVKLMPELGIRISIEDNAQLNRDLALIIHDTAARLG